MIQIAGGIVLGGLTLVFLLKTRVGWYVMIGLPFGAAVSAAWGFLVVSSMPEGSDGAVFWAWLASVPLAGAGAFWWAPRTVSFYRAASLVDDPIDPWPRLKWASEQAGNEVLYAALGIGSFVALIIAPFVWAFGHGEMMRIARGATLISWGFVGLIALAVLADKRKP